jgi:hypothetical protein
LKSPVFSNSGAIIQRGTAPHLQLSCSCSCSCSVFVFGSIFIFMWGKIEMGRVSKLHRRLRGSPREHTPRHHSKCRSRQAGAGRTPPGAVAHVGSC